MNESQCEESPTVAIKKLTS